MHPWEGTRMQQRRLAADVWRIVAQNRVKAAAYRNCEKKRDGDTKPKVNIGITRIEKSVEETDLSTFLI